MFLVMLVIVTTYLFWNKGLVFCGALAIILTILFQLLSLPKRILQVIYTMDGVSASKWDSFRTTVCRMCSKTTIWEVLYSSVNANSKYHGGAENSVGRWPIAVKTIKAKKKTGIGLNIRFDVPTLLVQGVSYKILFIPDGLLIQSGKLITTYTYDELTLKASTTRFVDSFPIAHDAEIVEYTWQYVNQNGSPDARFKDNYQRPVCIYGELIATASGHTFTVLTSGKSIARYFAATYRNYTNYVLSTKR